MSHPCCVCVYVCTWWLPVQAYHQFVTWDNLSQGVNCFRAFCIGGILFRRAFVSEGFYPGAFDPEPYMAKRRPLYHIFDDLEKAFDRIPRAAITWALRRQGITVQLVRVIMQLYVGSIRRVLTADGLSEGLEFTAGVHQGSPLSPLLFNLIMEVATKECTRRVACSMLYADDLVLTTDTWEEVVEELKRWKMAFERRHMKVNINKTKIMGKWI